MAKVYGQFPFYICLVFTFFFLWQAGQSEFNIFNIVKSHSESIQPSFVFHNTKSISLHVKNVRTTNKCILLLLWWFAYVFITKVMTVLSFIWEIATEESRC